jgi:hypothetical protein
VLSTGAAMPPTGAAPPVPGQMPGLAPGAPSVGPLTQIQPKPGNVAGAAAKVKNAIAMLQEALPDLPIGSEEHTAVLDAAKALSRKFSQIDVPPAAQQQARIEDVRRAQQGMSPALQRLGGGAPAMPAPAMV